MKVLKTPGAFPIHPTNSVEGLERLYDLLKIIYSDHHIGEEQEELLRKYAIGLGFSPKVLKSLSNPFRSLVV